MDNWQKGADEVKEIAEVNMHGFDELPPVIKRVLHEHCVDVNPAQIWRHLQMGASPDLIAIKIVQRSRALGLAYFKKSTGREYPDG